MTDCTLHGQLTSVHLHILFPAAVFLVFFFFSLSTDRHSAQWYNTHPDSCTHMDRTGLEFNLSFVSLQSKNSSHCHLDITHFQKRTAKIVPMFLCRHFRNISGTFPFPGHFCDMSRAFEESCGTLPGGSDFMPRSPCIVL